MPERADLSRFELFAEQLALAAQLVREGGIARERLALVAIDSLAEVLLYRHMQASFEASEEMGVLATRRFGQRDRDRLRQDFDRRVTLALLGDGRGTLSDPAPVLGGPDAAIFRIAHRYRNGLHHEDRANDTLLDPLARLYLTAVGRTWVRAQPASMIGGLSAARMRASPRTARVSSGGIVVFVDAARAIAAELLDAMEVEPRGLAERLADDLVRRADDADRSREDLVRQGLVAALHAALLRAAELRHHHRADPELVRLQDEASDAMGRLIEERSDDVDVAALQARYREAEAGQRERIVQLDTVFRPKLDLATANSTRKAAGRLRQVRDLDRLLARYETHDARLRLLEDCLAWIDREWDRFLSTEDEIRRGK